jgi:hypothetical protein
VLRPAPAIFDTFACLDDAARFKDARLDNWTFLRFDIFAAALASMPNFARCSALGHFARFLYAARFAT